MPIRYVEGIKQARISIKTINPLEAIDLNQTTSSKQIYESVTKILQETKLHGDSAVKKYSKTFDKVDLKSLKVTKKTIENAYKSIPKTVISALEIASDRIRNYHKKTMPPIKISAGKDITVINNPLEHVGLYAPGGKAAYPSTVLMIGIPAQVAGVKNLVLCTPPSNNGNPEDSTLVAADIIGITNIYKIGGVQAIGAMAFGTETIPKVDKICGPGNMFVTIAKKEVIGTVDIDGIFGPTETVIIADETTNRTICAADLIAQAEHDELASPILLTTSRSLAENVKKELAKQITNLKKQTIIEKSLENQGLIALVQNVSEAITLANEIAPEHLCLLVKTPEIYLNKIKNAGGIFVGEYSPEVLGDYIAGPSHVMPTGGTARYRSCLGVYDFIKSTPIVKITRSGYQDLAKTAEIIANAEGLTAHASALSIRKILKK